MRLSVGSLTVLLTFLLAAGSSASLADTLPPNCTLSIVGTGQAGLVDVTALDRGGANTGIASIELDVADPDFSNVQCTLDDGTDCTSLTFTGSLPNRAEFTLALDDLSDPLVGGQGRATVTDGAGNACTVSVAYVYLPEGPVLNQALFIDRVQASKFFVVEGTSQAAQMAITASVQPPAESDLACLPTGFAYENEATIISIVSSIVGDTVVIHDCCPSGDDTARMLFLDTLNGCPWEDQSDSVQDLVVDPRLKGGPKWGTTSPGGSGTESMTLNFARGKRQGVLPEAPPAPEATGSSVQFSAGVQVAFDPPRKETDQDGDGFFIGESVDPALVDCNDSNFDINPNGTEVCNGLDDDCDGVIDALMVSGEIVPLCGQVEITARLNVTGSDGSELRSGPLINAEVRIYDGDPGTCAGDLGNSPKNYLTIYGEGTLENPGCFAESSASTDENGVALLSVSPGFYIAVAQAKEPLVVRGEIIGITLGQVSAGDLVTKQMQLIINQNDDEVPSRVD